MDSPFSNPDLRTVYEETMSSIKQRLPRHPGSNAELFNRINGIFTNVNRLVDNPIKQIQYIEDNLYYLTRLNYQLKRLVLW